jgi:hypothetical protein
VDECAALLEGMHDEKFTGGTAAARWMEFYNLGNDKAGGLLRTSTRQTLNLLLLLALLLLLLHLLLLFLLPPLLLLLLLLLLLIPHLLIRASI